MAEINPEQIEEIVSQVINNLRSEGRIPSVPARSSKVGVSDSKSQAGIHPSTDQAIMAAKQAQAEFVQLGFAKRREIIEAIKRAALENAQRLADLAVEDTGMGNAAHKLMKNEGAVNLSPGVEDLRSEASTGDEGTLLVEYVPFGVINSITPTTNPTSTVINHAIIMLSRGTLWCSVLTRMRQSVHMKLCTSSTKQSRSLAVLPICLRLLPTRRFAQQKR